MTSLNLCLCHWLWIFNCCVYSHIELVQDRIWEKNEIECGFYFWWIYSYMFRFCISDVCFYLFFLVTYFNTFHYKLEFIKKFKWRFVLVKRVLRGDQRGNCRILAICLLSHQKEKGYMLTHQKNCSILAICSTVNSWSMLKAYMCEYVCCVIIFLIINSRDQYQLIANWFILYPNWISSICITSFCQNFPLFDLTPFHISWLWSWIPLICGQENEILVTVEIIDSPN